MAEVLNPTVNVSLTQQEYVYDYLVERLGVNHPLIPVASCESQYRQWGEDGQSLKGVVNSLDVGVLQINLKYHGERAEKLGIDLDTLPGNVDYAILLYESQGTQPWFWSEHCWG